MTRWDDIRLELPAFSSSSKAQVTRCRAFGIEAGELGVSHVAMRCRTWVEHVATREELEPDRPRNLETVRNGRPISKLLSDPIAVSRGRSASLIELIPPFRRRVDPMGLEHVGFVVGDRFDQFSVRHPPC